ncbi:TIM barrel protein [Anaerobacillus sp. CMMVII]|uniref:TIM barrel protein n=1 Tax=Anaerobacillus sp. CMMVII TaxID=2755588 RepID=UPI0028E0A2BC|nr:TIM barrel protein [Anaerobacillus sp. CMMVII]
MFIGSHVSIRNGYEHAAKNAKSIGATAFQYFPKNPRSISIKQFDKASAQSCAQFCEEKGIVSIAHTPYPTKLISENKELEAEIITSILNDLEIAYTCGSIGIVVHFGAMKGEATVEGYKKMIHVLNTVLQDWHGKALLLIENNAGAGTNMGITLEEMFMFENLPTILKKSVFALIPVMLLQVACGMVIIGMKSQTKDLSLATFNI